jgi:uncharacterized protein
MVSYGPPISTRASRPLPRNAAISPLKVVAQIEIRDSQRGAHNFCRLMSRFRNLRDDLLPIAQTCKGMAGDRVMINRLMHWQCKQIIQLIPQAWGLVGPVAESSQFQSRLQIAVELHRRLMSTVGEFERTQLHSAARIGQSDRVVRLLALGVPPDVQDLKGYSPLMIAARDGHTRIVEILRATPGVDLRRQERYGLNALMLAAHHNRLEILPLLLSAPGGRLEERSNEDNTAVVIAAKAGHQQVVAQLLAAGADPNAAGQGKMTALMHLAARGELAAVSGLCQHPRIDLNALNKEGQSALALAAARGHRAIVEYLLGRPGIGPHTRDAAGRTPLIAAVMNQQVEVAHSLLNGPRGNLEWVDDSGYSALTHALQRDLISVAMALIEQGVSKISPLDDSWIKVGLSSSNSVSFMRLLTAKDMVVAPAGCSCSIQ